MAKKIAVFSDTHGRTRGMLRAVQNEAPDLVFHLGDNERDAKAIERQDPVQAMLCVCGNCDYAPENPEARETEIEGVKIYAVHGHRHHVKYDLGPILNAGQFAGADIVLFGHSHRPVCRCVDGLWLLNPGTSGLGETPTYGVFEVENGKILRCEIYRIPKE